MNSKLLLFVIAGLIVSSYYVNDISAVEENTVGTIQWFETQYSPNGIGHVRIVDPDMNLDPLAVDNFDADVWSDTDVAGIEPTMTETGANTGVFESTVFFTTTIESSGHRLKVSEGDTITAGYQDGTLRDELYLTAKSLIQAPSLKMQLTDNIPQEKIECSDSLHVLTERTNGKLACVYQSTADKLGWTLITK